MRCTGFFAVVALVSLVLVSAGLYAMVHSAAWEATQMPDLAEEATVRYGAVIDAGSSGSRIFVYKWDADCSSPYKPRLVRDASGRLAVRKVEPGLSSFADTPHRAVESLLPLIEYAESFVPRRLEMATPLYIFATAGLRLLPEDRSEAILDAIKTRVPLYTSLHLEEEHVQAISGEEEGVYAWLAVNYAMQRLGSHSGSDKAPVGVLDMGGGSAQIAVQIRDGVDTSHIDPSNIVELNLRKWKSFKVYVKTFLGFGANIARHNYLASQRKESTDVVHDPCLLQNLNSTWSSHSHVSIHAHGTASIVGKGSYAECTRSLKDMFSEMTACPRIDTCKQAAPLKPPFPTTSEWIGFSEYWYTMHDVLRIGGRYEKAIYDTKAHSYCARNWTEVEQEYVKGYYPNVQAKRMKDQCFKSAWLSVMLHQGYGFTEDMSLTSLQEINGEEIGWTLGALLFLISSRQEVECAVIDPHHIYIAVAGVVFVAGAVFVYRIFTHRRKAFEAVDVSNA